MRGWVFLALLCLGCASAPKQGTTVPEPGSLVVHLIGHVPAAQACPVSEHVLITARHATQPAPSEETGLRWFRYSTDYGLEGEAKGFRVLWEADLAVLVTRESLKHYEIAPEPPAVGDIITAWGYDWRDEKRAFASRPFPGAVTRVQAGHLVYKGGGEAGTSGSCVLDSRGRVVAIHIGRKHLDNFRVVGLAPALWGRWFPRAVVEEAEASLLKPDSEMGSDALRSSDVFRMWDGHSTPAKSSRDVLAVRELDQK